MVRRVFVEKAVEKGDKIVHIVFSRKRGIYIRKAAPWVYNIEKGSSAQLTHWYLFGKYVPEVSQKLGIHHVAEIWRRLYGYYPLVKIVVSSDKGRRLFEQDFDDPYEAQIVYDELRKELPSNVRIYPLFQVILPSEKFPKPEPRWLFKQNLVAHILFKGIKYSEVPRGVKIPTWIKEIREKYGEDVYRKMVAWWLKRLGKPIYKATIPVFTLPVPDEEKVKTKPVIEEVKVVTKPVVFNGASPEGKSRGGDVKDFDDKSKVIKEGVEIAEKEMKKRKKLKKVKKEEVKTIVDNVKKSLGIEENKLLKKIEEIRNFLGERENNISKVLTELRKII